MRNQKDYLPSLTSINRMRFLEIIKDRLDKKTTTVVILLFFALIFGLITFVNHYTLRTSSDPLAIYTNCLYDYRSFEVNECTLLTPINAVLEKPFFDNKLSDHFNVIIYLVAPFSYVFGSWTLLIFQYLAILFGGWGVKKYFESENSLWLANLAMFHFFSIWGVYSALGFDYHDNVIAAMLLPWLFYFYRDSRWVWASVVSVLMLLCKENVSVWLFFIFGVLAVFNFKKKKKHSLYATISAFLALIYFIVVTKVVMPSLANEGREYLHFHYSALGSSYGEAIKFMLMNPIQTVTYMLTNHNDAQFGDGIKLELIYTIFLSGGFVLFIRPKYLFMVLPILGQKLLNDDLIKWGLNYHYCIEFVPILTFCVFEWLSEKKEQKNVLKIAMAIVFLTITITMIKNNTRTSKWFDKDKHNFLTSDHYTRSFDISEVHKAMAIVPDDESIAVSAHFNLLSYYSLRDKVYEFPVVLDSDYMVLLLDTKNTYPISKQEYAIEVSKYRKSKCWEVIYDENQLLILKRVLNTENDYEEYPWHIPREK